MDTLRRRPSACLLVLDPDDRVLLFRFVFTRGALAGEDYWSTLGGGVEPGETFEDAARRELFEETGIVSRDLGRHVAEREFPLRMNNGEQVTAEERFFVIRVEHRRVSRDGMTRGEQEVMIEHRWWSLDELVTTTETFWPKSLVGMLMDAGVNSKHPAIQQP